MNKPKAMTPKTIIGLHKKFNKKTFDKYDVPARNRIKEVLADFIEDNPNQYEQDFIIKSPTCRYTHLEVQVCATWVNEQFPHKNVFIYARKGVYDKNTLFLTTNKFLTRGYIFDGASFADVTPRRLRKYSREFVYDIPWNKVMNVYIDTLDKETIEMF